MPAPTVAVGVKVFEELVKVGVKVVLHALLEKVGQPQSVRVVHQTIIVHPHHLQYTHAHYMYITDNVRHEVSVESIKTTNLFGNYQTRPSDLRNRYIH